MEALGGNWDGWVKLGKGIYGYEDSMLKREDFGVVPLFGAGKRKKPHKVRLLSGLDGTRTRDLLRDRQAF